MTYDTDDEMEIDAEGDPGTDKSGIPELTEDVVVDEDVVSQDEPAAKGGPRVGNARRLMALGEV